MPHERMPHERIPHERILDERIPEECIPDPRILGPGLAPTPFTADEIRAGCPDGHWALVRTERGGETTFHRSGFEAGDAEGVTCTTTPTDASGHPTGPVTSRRATWAELQAHAAFQASSTTVASERIRLAFGERDCLRYDVAGDDGSDDGSGPATFWFALEHPGMPVRYVSPGFAAETIAVAG